MSNTWNGMTFTNIARTGFKAFNAALTPLAGIFATDFSSALADQGEIVQTRIVPVQGAAVDLQTGVAGTAGDREDANIIGDQTTSAVTVTLNQQPIRGFALTDTEASKIGSGVWADTRDKLLEQTAYQVALFVWNYVANLITNANYSTAVNVVAASAFDLDDVVDAKVALKGTYKWPTDMSDVSLVLNSDYIGALEKDNAIQDVSASGMDVAQSGILRKVSGLKVVEAPGLPPSGGTPASENLTGFYTKPAGVALAMRAVRSQATDKLAAYREMTDPVTGVTLVYRAWYKEAFGKLYHTFETLFGASVGQAEALKRITSA